MKTFSKTSRSSDWVLKIFCQIIDCHFSKRLWIFGSRFDHQRQQQTFAKLKRKSSEREFDYALRAESAEQLGANFLNRAERKIYFPPWRGVCCPVAGGYFLFQLCPKIFLELKKSVLPSQPALLSRIKCPKKRPNPSRKRPAKQCGTAWDALRDGFFLIIMRVGTEGRLFLIFIFFLAFQRKTDEPANAMSVVIVNVVARRNAQFLSAIVHLSNERIL